MAQWCGKFWCYTINAPQGSEEIDAFDYLMEIVDRFPAIEHVYHVCKGEVGESGNYHLQGYIEFAMPIQTTKIKSMFGSKSMHLEKREGTALQATRYVKKPETAWHLIRLYEDGNVPVERCPIGTFWVPEHRSQCHLCRASYTDAQIRFDEYVSKVGIFSGGWCGRMPVFKDDLDPC